MDYNIKGEEFILGALIGGAVGVAAAFFLAPMSGEKLRSKITNGFHRQTLKTKRHHPHTSHAHHSTRNTLKKTVRKATRKVSKAVKDL